jgi:protein required for attachment to host cells
MKLDNGTIVLVVDGSRMLLLRNRGDEAYPDLAVLEHRAFRNPPNRELMTDAPGVGFSTGHPGRATFEEGDPHSVNAQRFVAAAADALAQAAHAQAGDLVVVAPPETLGTLRRHYDRAVHGRIVAEIAKDFTKHPVAEIARLIVDHEH